MSEVYLELSQTSKIKPSEAVVRPELFCEKVFLEISQNSQENTCARPSTLLKKRLTQMYGGRELPFVKFTLNMKCEKEMKFWWWK